MDNIATEIKAKRKEHRLTQEELAMYAGVSAKFIVELESGKKTIRLDKLLAVLRVFDCTLEVRHICRNTSAKTSRTTTEMGKDTMREEYDFSKGKRNPYTK